MDWISHYVKILENQFDIQYIDSCAIAAIDTSDWNEDKLHQQFINGGIDKAVNYILKQEDAIFAILGFSVGGSIAWKACLHGLKIEHLFAVSSTRLRYETQKPSNAIHLYYGENDIFKPNPQWFDHMDLKGRIINNESHELYKKQKIAKSICDVILK